MRKWLPTISPSVSLVLSLLPPPTLPLPFPFSQPQLADDRTFADVSRYVLTGILGLGLPAPPETAPEARSLYAPPGAPSAPQLMKALEKRLSAWGGLLQRFVEDVDDQVELLLTLEEYCSREGVFRAAGGAAYAPHFQAVLNCCAAVRRGRGERGGHPAVGGREGGGGQGGQGARGQV